MCVREATRQAAEGKIALAPFNEATATALRARGAPPPVIAASTQLAPAAEGAQAPDAVPQIAGGAVLGLLRRSQHTASQEEERAKTVAPMPGCFEIGASDGDDLHGQVELGKMRGEGGGGSGGGDGDLVQIGKKWRNLVDHCAGARRKCLVLASATSARPHAPCASPETHLLALRRAGRSAPES